MRFAECENCKKKVEIYNKQTNEMTDQYLAWIDFSGESELKIDENSILMYLKNRCFCSLKCFAEWLIKNYKEVEK